MKGKLIGILALTCYWLVAVPRAVAIDHVVATTSELSAALAAAAEGDQILLQPGVYAGGHYRADLRQVVIRSVDPNNRAIIDGGGNAFQLSDAQQVTISDLVIRNQLGNGLNIDWGSSNDTTSSDITLRNLAISDILSPGNHDGIKLTGVNGFLIENVQIHNWGSGGSALDISGSHHGLIQNSLFTHTAPELGTTGVRPKGGSKDITIRANRVELLRGFGRAIQAGGSTDPEFYLFVDGDSGYEADEIVAEGNVVIDGNSAFSYVNIDGGVYHHNVVHRPGNWVARILNENRGLPIVLTQNGKFHDNRIVYNDVANEFHSPVNVGDDTLPETFQFARNKWLNLADPTPEGSTPILPVTEEDGMYGVDPMADPNAAQTWDFPWGIWIVNTNSSERSVDVANFQALQRATPGEAAKFLPLSAIPLSGSWTFESLPTATILLPAFSQTILIDPGNCLNCVMVAGDYDGNGTVEQADYDVWRAAFGTTSMVADGNGDGNVDAADYTTWRNAFNAPSAGGSILHPIAAVPESTSCLSCSLVGTLIVMLQRRRQSTEPTGAVVSAR